MSQELKKRWVTAILAIAVVLWGLLSPSVAPLFFITVLVAVVGVWEASRLLDLSSDAFVVDAVSVALTLAGFSRGSLSLVVFSLMLPLLFQALLLFVSKSPSVEALFPSLYLGIPLGFALYVKKLHLEWFLVAVAGCVWAGDAAAYFVGKAVGKTKLHPVSPKKTVEGALGGLVIGTLFFGVVAFAFLGWGVFKSLFAGIAVNAAGQLGDLFESFLKRRAGVKDSGAFFPGHGGVLDRIDSLLFALFTASIFF